MTGSSTDSVTGIVMNAAVCRVRLLPCPSPLVPCRVRSCCGTPTSCATLPRLPAASARHLPGPAPLCTAPDLAAASQLSWTSLPVRRRGPRTVGLRKESSTCSPARCPARCCSPTTSSGRCSGTSEGGVDCRSPQRGGSAGCCTWSYPFGAFPGRRRDSHPVGHPARPETPRRPGPNPQMGALTRPYVVGDTRIELVTSSVSSNSGEGWTLGFPQLSGLMASVDVRVGPMPRSLSRSCC